MEVKINVKELIMISFINQKLYNQKRSYKQSELYFEEESVNKFLRLS